MQIGFIGLGIMGSRMAANLQQGGYELVVHNRTKAKADELVANGAIWAETPAALAQQVEILFTMLADRGAVEDMAFGPEGFLDHLSTGILWVDASTVHPAFSKRMAVEARRRNLRFVDAPMAGTKGPAERGELLILPGGGQEDIQQLEPFFDLMGRGTIHVGGHGMGTSLKMVLNLLLGEAMVAFSEAMLLGESLGLERDMLFDVLLGGPVVAPFVSGKREKIAKGAYEAEFPLQWMHKDMHLAALTAYEQGAPLPTGNVVKEIYALAERAGLAGQDFSAVYAYLQGEHSMHE
jgi:3-hydroxyisobutyrate dehydrogenase-like beta-hydroxyacid dehydrogenase